MTTTLAESGLSAGKKFKRLQMLLVGAPGSRKTVTAHFLPRTRTLDFDDGMQSVEWAVLAGHIKKGLNEIVYETLEPEGVDEQSMVDLMNRATDVVDEWVAEEDVPPEQWNKPYPQFWDTLIVDSASFMNDAAVALGLYENNRLDLSKSWKEAIKGIKKDDRHIHIAPIRIQDWGAAGSIFMKATRQWKALGKNLVVVAHEYDKVSDSGLIEAVQPAVIGQLRTKLPAAFDEVWYTRIKPSTSRDPARVQFLTQNDSKREGKTRIGCLDQLEEADFGKIRQKIAKFYKIPEDMLWSAEHGEAGRTKAAQEAAEEAVTV